ncbi:unnamed protein product [Blepharisma stoltei]|uniref:Uncharacterized protein n=1 Tax=Blepharisma stoltei TaxID=1481888 RepID=A0AAU9JSG2_9CILI|nr:unnamed protein product [Blepharisma stoltei]
MVFVRRLAFYTNWAVRRGHITVWKWSTTRSGTGKYFIAWATIQAPLSETLAQESTADLVHLFKWLGKYPLSHLSMSYH